ncbi:hypothetical protein [Cellvibrio fontiphilus]|uniref:Uncharacterized protein n=1 Tax=Cellvibrio fontiphilus TaxID=1815559 RepID=A0ABV7FCM1_9GAMM
MMNLELDVQGFYRKGFFNHTQPSSKWMAVFLWLVIVLLVVTSLTLGVQSASAAEKIPRLNGKPDFSGIWQTTSAADYDLEPHSARIDAPPGPGVVEGGEIPYKPEALAKRKQNFENRFKADPRLKGWTLGVPRGIYYPEPLQIFQRERDITIIHQFGHSIRTIHTNGTDHPRDPNDWWLGDSRAKWEGNTLVVDVKHFNDETWLDRSGNYHSDALHVVERWTLIDANTIEYKARISDEKVFTRPWDITVFLHRHREPNFQLVEDYRFTLDYDQYYPYPAERAPKAQPK